MSLQLIAYGILNQPSEPFQKWITTPINPIYMMGVLMLMLQIIHLRLVQMDPKMHLKKKPSRTWNTGVFPRIIKATYLDVITVFGDQSTIHSIRLIVCEECLHV